jgi:hypothetical protein
MAACFRCLRSFVSSQAVAQLMISEIQAIQVTTPTVVSPSRPRRAQASIRRLLARSLARSVIGNTALPSVEGSIELNLLVGSIVAW